MDKKVIKILIVEDSPVATLLLKRIFASSPEIEVVGTAKNGREALVLIPELLPDVIATDFHMPQMNGLEFTREVMLRYPRPILVISASVQKEDTHNIFQMLEAGALDVFPKPSAGIFDHDWVKQALIGKVKVLSGVTVFTKHRSKAEVRRHRDENNLSFMLQPSDFTLPKIIAIGASTGGPQALHAILTQLPLNFPVPIICIQHISEGFLQGLVDWFSRECCLAVKIARLGEVPLPGTIYFAPEKTHLELDTQGRFTLSQALSLGGHCPSVTVTFQSVAKSYHRTAVGILLTGMGRDGAAGMQAIAQAGGVTIAQDEHTSVVFGMPKEAIALGAAQYILPINQIAPMLITKMFVKKI